jgi:hypothetical protein
MYVFILTQMKLNIPGRNADSDQKPPNMKFICTSPTELEVHSLSLETIHFQFFSNNRC